MYVRQLPLWITDTNCWIISKSASNTECILVDVPPSPSEILSTLASNGLTPVAILATHGHIDHIGGAGTISRAKIGNYDRPDIPIYINNADKHMLVDPVGTSGMLGQELLRSGLNVSPPEFISNLDDGDTFTGLGMKFTTIATPGHTQGSICLLTEEDETSDKILFSGDHLFKGSIGRTDLPGGSFEMLVESMRSKIFPLDDDLAVLPGHGETTTIGMERTSNPFLLHMQTSN